VRILLTVPSVDPTFGGPPTKVFALSDALRDRRYDVKVVGCGSAGTAVGLPVLVRYHGTPVPRSTRALTALVRGADLVHVIGLRDPVGLVAAIAARRSNVPYVIEPVGMHRPRLRNVLLKTAYDKVLGDRILRYAKIVVATSRLEATELIREGVQATRVRVRPNGIDVDDLLPLPPRGAFRQRLGLPPEAALLVSIGRIARKKRSVDIARAIARMPGVHAAIVGPDEGDGTLQELERAQSSLGIQGRLHVIPRWVEGAEKARLLADADVFCLPSLTENFGIAAAEAAAVGLPVVVSGACGVAEYLDPACSRVVEARDVTALVSALEELVCDATIKPKTEAAAVRLRARLSWHDVSGQQADIYGASLVS